MTESSASEAAERSHAGVERVKDALRSHGIEPRVRWFESATPTAVSAAAELGVEVGAIANSLVFTIDGGPAAGLTFSRIVARLRVP